MNGDTAVTDKTADSGVSNQCVKEGKSSRFAKRKKQRPKRFRSDGFVVGLDLGHSSEDDNEKNGHADAFNFLQWIRNPTVQNLGKLRRAIKSNDRDWMTEFLEYDGLGLLFQCLKNLSEYQGFHLSDMVLRMECIMCIREVINSQSGLDCLLKIKGRRDNIFGRRFASALETKNLMVKMQIFELLSALCVYSRDGFYLTLDALERYKTWQKLPFRFSLLLIELSKADLIPYKTTLMALINSVIVANENIKERVRIRNEFNALNVLDLIQSLRTEDDEELNVQCDVFEEELSADADAMTEIRDGNVNLADSESVFKAVYNRVHGTPVDSALLGILHSLLNIDLTTTNSETTWNLVERLAYQAITADCFRDSDRLIAVAARGSKTHKESKGVQTESTGELTSHRVHRQNPLLTRGSRVLTSHDSGSGAPVPQTPPPPPPPPPPLPGLQIIPPPPPSPGGPPPPPSPFLIGGVPPPPPPPPPGSPIPPPPPFLSPRFPPPPPSPGIPPPPSPGIPPPPSPGAPPPPPSPGGHLIPPSPSGVPPSPGFPSSPVSPSVPAPKTIETPMPHCKMKTLMWNKIPVFSYNKTSIWGDIIDMKDEVKVEYGKLEECFGQKGAQLSVDKPEENKLLRRQSTSMEVTLLDPKRSMNINIFLKQFRKSNEEIVELIKKGDTRSLGVEKLKGLVKILPQQDEVEQIHSFDGEVEKLGNAEKFFYHIINLSSYKLRLEAMVLKADFNSQLGGIRPNVQVLTSSCRQLYDNPSLKSFLRLVLHAGNYLNKGSNSGEALGFRISSLNKIAMTKSNVARKTLLHHLVEQTEQQHKNALDFVDELLGLLQKASRFTLASITAEFTQLKNSVSRLQRQMENAEDDVKSQYSGFLEEADVDMGDVEDGLDRVQKLSQRLAQHFCENEKTFHVDEFLESFREFCEKIKICQQDLENSRQLAEKVEKRKKAQEEMMEKRRSSQLLHQAKTPEAETPGKKHILGPIGPDKKIVDSLVSEIRKGQVLRRLSLRRKKPNPNLINPVDKRISQIEKNESEV